MRCKNPPDSNPMSMMITERQFTLGRLVVAGKLNKEIAWDLGLTEGTVKVYMSHLFKKLKIRNRTEFALWMLNQQKAAE